MEFTEWFEAQNDSLTRIQLGIVCFNHGVSEASKVTYDLQNQLNTKNSPYNYQMALALNEATEKIDELSLKGAIKLGYYRVKFYNSDANRVMKYTTNGWESFGTDEHIHDKIESWEMI